MIFRTCIYIIGHVGKFTNSPRSIRVPSDSSCPSVVWLNKVQLAIDGVCENLILCVFIVTASRIERECPNRHYVFERHTRKKLKLPPSEYKEMIAANRTDCEDKCLNEFTFVCRSVTYDSASKTCWLTRFTRRSHPELLEDDPSSDYLENTCLNGTGPRACNCGKWFWFFFPNARAFVFTVERRCDGPVIFVKEENKRLGGPFEVDIFANLSLIECQAQCLRAEKWVKTIYIIIKKKLSFITRTLRSTVIKKLNITIRLFELAVWPLT